VLPEGIFVDVELVNVCDLRGTDNIVKSKAIPIINVSLYAFITSVLKVINVVLQ